MLEVKEVETRFVKLTECGVVCLDGSLQKGDLESLGVILVLINGVLNIKMPGGWKKQSINQHSFCLIDQQGKKILKITQGKDTSVVKVELLLKFRVRFRCTGNNGTRNLFAQIFKGDKLLLSTYPKLVKGAIEDAEAELIRKLEQETLRRFDNESVLYVRDY